MEILTLVIFTFIAAAVGTTILLIGYNWTWLKYPILSISKKANTTGAVHTVPTDLRKALTSNSDVLEKWNNLTPLAQNEWICWTIIVKKPETRKEHIERLCADLLKGKRRPCCWPGCPHRRPNAKKWFPAAQS